MELKNTKQNDCLTNYLDKHLLYSIQLYNDYRSWWTNEIQFFRTVCTPINQLTFDNSRVNF
ncbi:hypothetical protein ABH942_002238 [Flavobacterium sp. 28YEA47A]